MGSVSYTFDSGLTVGVEQLWPLLALPVAVGLLAYLVAGLEVRIDREARSVDVTRSPSPVSASTWGRRLLLASRVLVVCLLVFGAMEPYTVVTQEVQGEPEVTMLVDESDSMAVYEAVNESLAEDIEAEGVPVRTVTVGDGAASPVGDSLVANLRENGTVVVVSDGQVTEGRGLGVATERALSLNATVSTVDLSTERKEVVVDVAGPSTVSRGLETRYTATIDGVRFTGRETVELEIDGETVATEQIDATGAVTVNHTFEETGYHRVTARVDANDAYARNDVYHRSVQVVEPPNVLYVAGGEYPLESYLDELYNVTTASSVPADLEEYEAVVVQDRHAEELGDVGALQDHVVGGGGLVVVGGESAYENGAYNESAIAPMLPVSIGEDEGGAADIVLAVDVSGSVDDAEPQKAQALDVVEQLDDESRVGVVAFNWNAYRVAELQPVGENREEIANRIRRLETRGGTDLAVGLLGARAMLGDRSGTVVLLSDGEADATGATAVARDMGREGTRLIVVGAGDRLVEENLKRVSDAAGGTYFAADQTDRLQLLFGGGTRQFGGDSLTVISPNTFITDGVELTSNPGNANEVSVKQGADFQVATADGEPAIASWRFGLGRVVSVTTFDDQSSLDGLLEEPDSLVTTRSVNYAVGDPTRTQTGVTSIEDGRVGTETTLLYRGEERPQEAGVTFERVGDGEYRGRFTPQVRGFQQILDAEYAANYRQEYAAFGRSGGLASAVEATGGRTYDPDAGAEIASQARQQAGGVRSVRNSWGWAALLVALLVFAAEIVTRRVQVYRGRSQLESGLP